MARTRLGNWSQRRRPVGRTNLALWLHHMGLMQQSGIDVVRAIRLLAEQEPNPRLQWVCRQVLSSVSLQGSTLSTACAQYPSVFSPPVLLCMQAGEFSGDLPGCLRRAGSLLESQDSLERRIRQALTPPLTMIGICLAILALVVNFVLPRLLELFEGLHIHPSTATVLVMGAVHWSTGPGVLWFLAAVAFLALYQAPLKEAFLAQLLRNRVTSRLFGRDLAISFCDLVGRLHGQGIPMLRILELVRSNTDNRYQLRHMQAVQTLFVAGRPLSEAVRSVPYFPRVVSDMIVVGEQTGSLHEVLTAAVRLLDEDTQDWIARLTSMIEPIVLAGTGVFVAAIMLSVLMPLYQLMEAIQ